MIAKNPCKMITGTVRLSYANVWEPRETPGGTERYGCTALIPKADTETLDRVNEAVGAALAEGGKRFGEGWKADRLPVHDGDKEREDDAYRGCWYIGAYSRTAPQIVDRNVEPITDRGEIYSGVYARAALRFYPYGGKDANGVACALGNIQKVRDGERIGGSNDPMNEFTVVDDADLPF